MAKTKPSESNKKKTIVFLHPDLGIGGAERLVVDAAVGLQNRGHKVVIFTSHCDPKHCFDEARDGTLDVRVRGNTLIPPSLLGRFSILCAILRQLHLILQITLLTNELRALRPTHFFVDQLSAGLPLLQLLNRLFQPRAPPVFFYCHFPDLLLVQGRESLLKKLYRIPFDMLEQTSMSCADAIAVNSKFTRGVVSQTWPGLAKRRELKVVYPCIDTGSKSLRKGKGEEQELTLTWGGQKKIILSINRFERKKDVALAIKAFAGLSPEARKDVRLVIAGGYDNRVAENVGYHKELTALATTLKLRFLTANSIVSALSVPDDIDGLFLLSVPAALKAALLRSARLLVYTPANEHFGIVPLEAMLAGVPVLACDTGGPTETVVEGETGWLRSAGSVEKWTEVMDRVLNGMSEKELDAMRKHGVERVLGRFADVQMAETLDGILDEMVAQPKVGGDAAIGLFVWTLAGLGAVIAILSALWNAMNGFSIVFGPRKSPEAHRT